MKTPDEADLSCYYLWFDTEYTTLNLDAAILLQVALVVTNSNLERIAPPEQDFCVTVSIDPGKVCDPWVEENLAPLLKRCRSTEAIPVDEVNRRIADYLDGFFGTPKSDSSKRPALAGNSLHCDWFLARKFLPALIARANFRCLDVTGWKLVWKNHFGAYVFDKKSPENLRRYFPGEFTSSESNHDAHFDVLASIAELNFYRQHQPITWQPDKS